MESIESRRVVGFMRYSFLTDAGLPRMFCSTIRVAYGIRRRGPGWAVSGKEGPVPRGAKYS